MINTNYGFSSSYSDSETRYAQVTDYAKANGAYWSTSTQYFNNGLYWLRSPYYYYSYSAYYVYYGGNDRIDYVHVTNYGVRTACNINLE